MAEKCNKVAEYKIYCSSALQKSQADICNPLRSLLINKKLTPDTGKFLPLLRSLRDWNLELFASVKIW